MSFLPSSKPAMSQSDMMAMLQSKQIKESILVVGIRGYFDGHGGNNRGVYDDAIFVVATDTFAGFNGNTDPSAYRKGHGTGDAKGMACLKPGLYHAHQLGLHRGKYMALIQTGGEVTVIRDGTPPYEDTGDFGINIHHGTYTGTSSLGCQTVHPDQWQSFISLVQTIMHHNKMSTMPYLLVEA